MRDNQKEASIVLPDNLKEGSASAIALCELFVSKLFDSSKFPVAIRVDSVNSVVYCSDSNIKEVVNIFLKTKKLPMFYEQFKDLLIDGHLLCVKDGLKHSFKLSEDSRLPDLDWTVDLSD